MKLKTFVKVNTSSNTRYAVFNGEQFVEDFTVNYLDEHTKLTNAILKRVQRTIRNHSTNKGVNK